MSDDSDSSKSALPLLPGVRPGQLPPFHSLGEDTFQNLCRDLLEVEPGIVSADIYGNRGQMQRGIDVIGYAKHHIEVAQCKCHQSFPAGQIRAATDKFFEHWDYWKDKSVRRFVLAVACAVTDRECHDQFLLERKRFAEIGIEYESWGPPQLYRRLQAQPQIVRQHFVPSDFWAAQIAGVHSPQTGAASGGQFLQAQIGLLADSLKHELGLRLDHLKSDWHRGRRLAVAKELTAIRQDTTRWNALSRELKARVLRFQAGIRLDLEDDLAGARQLHQQSADLHPEQDDAALRALIALRESGFEAAFRALDDAKTPSAQNFRASLLLDVGRPQEALPAAASDDPDALRTRALALALTGNIDDATKTINVALAAAPEWESLSFAAAAIDYLATVAPHARPDWIPFAPEPIEWTLVFKDPGSQRRLATAIGRLERLLAECEGERQRTRYEAWLIACLANRVDEQERAAKHVTAVLEKSPGFWPAIIWALARSYEIDLDASVNALKTSEREFDCTSVAALAACEIARGTPGNVIETLKGFESAFLSVKALELWLYWMVQALIRSGQVGSAHDLLKERDPEQSKAPHAWSLFLRASASTSTGDTKEQLFRLYEATSDAALLVDACEIAARENAWTWITTRAQNLIDAVGTADAIHLVAIAQHNTHDYTGALGTIEKYARQAGEAGLSPQLRRVRLAASNQVGLLNEAIADAETLARGTGSAESRMELARLLIQTGDTAGACRVAQQMLSAGQLDVADALRLAFAVKIEDRVLAKALIEFALTQDIPDELVGPAFALGTEFNIGPAIKPIAVRFFALGQAGKHGITAVSIAEVIELAKRRWKHTEQVVGLYEEGRLPIHIVASHTGAPLAKVYGRQFSQDHRSNREGPRGGWVLSLLRRTSSSLRSRSARGP